MYGQYNPQGNNPNQNQNAPFMPMNTMNRRASNPNVVPNNFNRNNMNNGMQNQQGNYGQGNYQQMPKPGMQPGMNQMYPQGNMSNAQPCFIGGRIGGKEIVRFDYQTFVSQVNDPNWVSNPIYSLADSVRITTPLQKSNSQMNMQLNIPNSNLLFGQYIIDSNNMLTNEFNNYLINCQERKQKLEGDKESNRIKFISEYLKGVDISVSYDEMLKKINENKCFIISKDLELKNSIQKYLDFITNDEFGAGGSGSAPPPNAGYGNNQMGGMYNINNQY